MPHALPEQHAAITGYASYGSKGTWPEQHMPGAVKPMETITLKDGSLADIAVVGDTLPFLDILQLWLLATSSCN